MGIQTGIQKCSSVSLAMSVNERHKRVLFLLLAGALFYSKEGGQHNALS